MVIGTPDGMSYEDEMHRALGIPMFANLSSFRRDSTQEDIKKSPNYDPKTDIYQANQLTEPKEIHIVRHGETTENADNTVRGWEPVSLNERGRQEAEKAADELKSKGIDTIVSSDLQRAKETSEIIGKKLGIEPQYDPRLRTWNVGEHAGKPCETSNLVLKKFVQDTPDKQVPGGESFNVFTDRSFAGIRDAILNNKDKKLAIVTHNRVEATLKGWEKTGQDNPDIDVNEAVKEETEPGVVRPFTMQPDSSIMKDDVNVYKNLNEAIQAYLMNKRSKEFEGRFKGLSDFGRERTDTFGQRFQGQDKLPIEGPSFDPRKMPDWWTRQTGTTPFPEDLKNLPLTEQTGPLPDPGGAAKFTPVGGVKPYPSKGPTTQEDTVFSRFSEVVGEAVAEQLMAILKDPTAEIPLMFMGGIKGKLTAAEEAVMNKYMSSGSLRGGKRIQTPVSERWTEDRIKEFTNLYQQGKSDKEIADKLGIARGTVRSKVDEFGLSQ